MTTVRQFPATFYKGLRANPATALMLVLGVAVVILALRGENTRSSGEKTKGAVAGIERTIKVKTACAHLHRLNGKTVRLVPTACPEKKSEAVVPSNPPSQGHSPSGGSKPPPKPPAITVPQLPINPGGNPVPGNGPNGEGPPGLLKKLTQPLLDLCGGTCAVVDPVVDDPSLP